MPYSPRTRVIHVNGVAGVAQSLVATAQGRHHNWHFRPLIPVRPPLAQAALQRLVDIPRWMIERRHSDLTHIHYGANGYLGWGTSTPTVLHLHGSDVRSDLHRPGIAQLTAAAIKKADLVLYSTTDLEAAVQEIRPDAQWLPNPLPQEVFSRTEVTPSLSERVVFATRWDSTKGSTKLASIAHELSQRGIDCHGLNWGADASLAQEAGVTLHPLMQAEDYLNFLTSARMVIGQISFGVPGLSELQAMAMGLPVAMHAPGGPVLQVNDSNAPDVILETLQDSEALEDLARRGREWARIHHHPERVFDQLVTHYEALLGSSKQ